MFNLVLNRVSVGDTWLIFLFLGRCSHEDVRHPACQRENSRRLEPRWIVQHPQSCRLQLRARNHRAVFYWCHKPILHVRGRGAGGSLVPSTHFFLGCAFD